MHAREGQGAVVRQRHLIALVVAFLIGCAFFLVAGASKVQAQASKKEEARCEGTRETKVRDAPGPSFLTNDLPGCSDKGGPLSGTDDYDKLAGKEGDDEIRGLGVQQNMIYGGSGSDTIYGGPGSDMPLYGGEGEDVIYGGPSGDFVGGGQKNDSLYGGPGGDVSLYGNKGEDLIYGGDGNDHLGAEDGQADKLYCGKGKDTYRADKKDYVDSSCEKERFGNLWNDVVSATPSASASPFPGPPGGTGGPAILLPAAALLLGSGILTYAILRRR